jgi:hypothetical protein
MKFCPVVPEICRGQVHGPQKERRKRRIIIIKIKIIIRNGANTINNNNNNNYHRLIKTMLCFVCSDQREPHIHASNDRFIKLQTVTLGKISLSGLRIIFNFSRESIHANPLETKSGRGGEVFFRRMQNGAFCCILDIKSV